MPPTEGQQRVIIAEADRQFNEQFAPESELSQLLATPSEIVLYRRIFRVGFLLGNAFDPRPSSLQACHELIDEMFS